jgi:hypothetical protein
MSKKAQKKVNLLLYVILFFVLFLCVLTLVFVGAGC